MSSSDQPTHSVSIEKVIAGGKGLARTEAGQVIMSGFVLPGESVQLREISQKPGYLEAELAQVLLPSTARVQPRCPLYGECGGCDLQHGTYAEQLQIKQAIVMESLARARLQLPAARVRNTLPSPQQWSYRHRLRLKISPTTGQLGFYKKRSNEFIAIAHCPVAAEEINAALAALRSAACLRDVSNICQEVELHLSPADRRLTLVLSIKGKQQIPVAVVQALAACACLDHVGCTNEDGFRPLYAQRGAAESLRQQISLPEQCYTLSWSGGCFSQVNPSQNVQLLQLALVLAQDVRGQAVLDLYCGMGNFSIPFGLAGAEVLGIEGNQESINWAKRNAKAAGVTARFWAAEVQDSVRQMVKTGQRAELVLLDPPRAGIGKTAALLPALKPQRILYISCDPVTLARDLALLCGKGFQLIELVPLDMFPQTSHIETVALLAAR